MASDFVFQLLKNLMWYIETKKGLKYLPQLILNPYINSLILLSGSLYPGKEIQSNCRFSNMYSNTGIMQNALLVLHNALPLSSLRNANQLKLMESSQVDGNLPRAWPWNICDSSNVIDAAKVKDRKSGGGSAGWWWWWGGGHRRVIWVWRLAWRRQKWLSLHVIEQGMKNVVYPHVYFFYMSSKVPFCIHITNQAQLHF